MIPMKVNQYSFILSRSFITKVIVIAVDNIHTGFRCIVIEYSSGAQLVLS